MRKQSCIDRRGGECESTTVRGFMNIEYMQPWAFPFLAKLMSRLKSN